MNSEQRGASQRLDSSNFDLPVHELRSGYRSAVYFWRTKHILEQEKKHPRITHQIFQKNDNVRICGTDEAIQILRCATGFYKDYGQAQSLFQRFAHVKKEMNRQMQSRNEEALRELVEHRLELSLELDHLWVDTFAEIDVYSLQDGEALSAWETAMLIEGDYSYFAHLESVYLGVLARRTKICTNSHAVVQAAQGKPVLFFTDRFDHFWLQDGDGYAAHLGGVSAVASNAMASWYGEQGIGTIPHAMIVSYDGDSVQATEKFNQYFPQANTIALVDFDNDCVNTALATARRLGDKLWGVRLDTASNLVDKSLTRDPRWSDEEKAGVSAPLVETVRTALDREGFQHVKIIVSGGFNPEKIARFVQLDVPVDIYAVGSWILSGQFDFTADAVRLNGRNLAKVGREYKPNDRLLKVD
ncbi:MAG: quinolinate phosphoribosyl transferase [bacterium]